MPDGCGKWKKATAFWVHSWLKKQAQALCLASLNVGTTTGKSKKVAEKLKRRKMQCFVERNNEKPVKIDGIEFKSVH